MSGGAITGWGFAVPDGRLTNSDLSIRLDTTDAWIRERTGIDERRIAGGDDTTASLAAHAATEALKHAGLTPDDVGVLLVATCTPDQQVPSTASLVADRLGLQCGALDVGAACAGFVYGLVVGSSLVGSGGVETAVIAGAECLSRITDPDDRTTAILFGDGAGAVVLQSVASGGFALPPVTGGAARTVQGQGLLGWDLGCDPSAAALLEIPAGERYLRMEGREVFRRAVRVVVDSAHAALGRARLGVEDVDVFVPHQANARMIESIGERLGIGPERTLVNIDRFGNTSAASIPIALAEAAEEGRLHDGDVLLLSGFGAGMTWASAVLTWGGRP